MQHPRECRRHDDEFGPCSCSLGKLSRLIEPVLLYLLANGQARHGLALVETVSEMALTDSEIDVGAIYRALRALEQARVVRSRWQEGHGGPRRRLYTITAAGEQCLSDWAVVLERLGRQMVDFAERCNELR